MTPYKEYLTGRIFNNSQNYYSCSTCHIQTSQNKLYWHTLHLLGNSRRFTFLANPV